MNKTNKILISNKKYKKQELASIVGKQVCMLSSIGYVSVISCTEDNSYTVIEFVPFDLSLGEPFPYFLTQEEAFMAFKFHNSKTKEELDQMLLQLNELDEVVDMAEFNLGNNEENNNKNN